MKYSITILIMFLFVFSTSYANHGEIIKDTRSNEEWARILTTDQYEILRNDGTEPSYSSPLNDEKRQGVFACAACGLALFDSNTKYDSKTGWPSFWQPIKGHIETKTDWKLFYPRTEYHCARCGSHQGHIFEDGPPEHGGKRYCNNGLALNFIPEHEKKKER